MFQEILIAAQMPGDRHEFNIVDSEHPRDVIWPLSRINLFVGPNNCGKSWLLRVKIKMRSAKRVPYDQR